MAWKSVKILGGNAGLEPCGSPKSCLKMAFAQSWIDDEPLWLGMLEARNRMSHTYHAKDAIQVYDRLSQYLRPMRTHLAALRTA